MATRKIGEHCLLIGFMVSTILILSAGPAFATSWDRHIYNYSGLALTFEVFDEIHGSVWFHCPGYTENGGWKRDSCTVPSNTAIEITYTTTSGSQVSEWHVRAANVQHGGYEGFGCRGDLYSALRCSLPAPSDALPVSFIMNDPAGGDIEVPGKKAPALVGGPGDTDAGDPTAAPGTGTVYGVVAVSTTGQGVPLATITLRLSGSNSATESTSGPDGSFLFDNLAPGEYSIIAVPSNNDYVTWCAMVTVEAGSATPVNISMLMYPSDDSAQ